MIHRHIITIFILLFITACGGEPGSDPGGYVVSLNLNGGRFSEDTLLKYGGAFKPTPLKEILADVINDPVVSDGRVFAVWNTESDGSGTDYIDDTLVKESVTLHAIYGNVIHTRHDLENIECGDADKIYVLDQEIFIDQGTYWEPLCPSFANPFKGRLYGRGNSISNLETKTSDAEMPTYGGLFAITEGAQIKDISLLEVHTAGRAAVGAVAAVAVDSDIDRVDVTGEISGYGYIGGVAGTIEDGTVIRRSSFGKVQEHEEKTITMSGGNTYAGGICGFVLDSAVSDCSSDSDIISEQASSRIGGIAGYVENGTIDNCIHEGTIYAFEGSRAETGGIAGRAENSEITRCYTETIIDGSTDPGSGSGGIVGYLSFSGLSDSAAFGIALSGASAGRIVGLEEGGALENVYARGDTLINRYISGDGGGNGKGRSMNEIRESLGFFQNTLGFDFSSSWIFNDYYDFPRLYWENVPAFTEINTADRLRRMSRDLNGWYVLTKDIDLSDTDEDGYYVTWRPMGDTDDPFTGRLKGNGMVIKNLVLPYGSSEYKGLFGFMEDAVVSDLQITVRPTDYKDIYEDTTGAVGVLAGYVLSSRIENVKVTGSTYQWQNTGGIAGSVTGGYMANVSFDGSLLSFNDTLSFGNIGGITGIARHTALYYVSSSGSINASSQDSDNIAGGLVGNIEDVTVSDSFSGMDVYASGGAESTAGGLVGLAEGSAVLRGYSTGDIHASSVHYTDVNADVSLKAGGIAGYILDSSVEACAAFGDSVLADTDDLQVHSEVTFASRIVGRAETSSVTNSYANEDMSVDADAVGGPAGTDIRLQSLPQDFFAETLGWDFEYVWEMLSGSLFPVLLNSGGEE